MLSARILTLHLSAILLRLLLLVMRLLLLVVMLLHLLDILTLFILLSRVSHLISFVVIELLKILIIGSANHHTRILISTSCLALAREGHVFMILLSNGSIWIFRRFQELVLRIQNIDILQILTRLLK